MNVCEMEGFLRGKCLPGDLLVGESNAAYLVRKLNESATLKADLNASLNAERSWETSMMAACGEDGPASVSAFINALAVENSELKARTVTVPAKLYVKDMRCNVVRWSQVIDAISDAGVAFVRDDGELIAGTRETPATSAALAAIEARILPTNIAEIIDSGDIEAICFHSNFADRERIRMALYEFRQLREAK